MQVPDAELATIAHSERVLADRLAWLLFSATELSERGYVRIMWAGEVTSQRAAVQWRVTVRWHGHEWIAACSPELEHLDRHEALLVALDRAVAWLRQRAADAIRRR
jgi:hypothetical protein